MEISVKIFATFRKYLSKELACQSEFYLSLAYLPGNKKTISSLIEFLNLPSEQIGQVIINGHIKWDKTIELRPGDRIVLQPYIGGG